MCGMCGCPKLRGVYERAQECCHLHLAPCMAACHCETTHQCWHAAALVTGALSLHPRASMTPSEAVASALALLPVATSAPLVSTPATGSSPTSPQATTSHRCIPSRPAVLQVHVGVKSRQAELFTTSIDLTWSACRLPPLAPHMFTRHVAIPQGKQDNLQSAPSAGSGFGSDAAVPGAAATGAQGQPQLHQQVAQHAACAA